MHLSLLTLFLLEAPSAFKYPLSVMLPFPLLLKPPPLLFNYLQYIKLLTPPPPSFIELHSLNKLHKGSSFLYKYTSLSFYIKLLSLSLYFNYSHDKKSNMVHEVTESLNKIQVKSFQHL